ncbi:zinc metalloproteinase nas-13 [Trichonephila clavata]|uniref:Metalloendopeptidase n=1 Tax=Trichonephila clavata TaxID=2740835 RepID=A0A8X6GLX0_TRICU|nr:zinc metalloproteinase nas-13 [Trichonephila clavata]
MQLKLGIAKYFEPEKGFDPLHKSGHFEGDILKPKFIEERNAIRDNRMKWPHGAIPYVIANTFDHQERSIIARAIEEYHKNTCIRFFPRNNENDFVFITRKEGCFSMIGRDGGPQLLSLGDGCMFVGIIIHEFMHAVGFWHEQSRADRDNYVTILWENIQQEMCSDSDNQCRGWAERGECKKNPKWMLSNCKKSCNQCRSIFVSTDADNTTLLT